MNTAVMGLSENQIKKKTKAELIEILNNIHVDHLELQEKMKTMKDAWKWASLIIGGIIILCIFLRLS
ncbi:MAG: hypothetical protein ACJA2R_000314 [Saprospiraceae bacterium]|jgi:hypothetical protein|tara:strand:+ start:5874 stop:6074 length:201 start_codon:yes stop_codon:yes gene_type:complete